MRVVLCAGDVLAQSMQLVLITVVNDMDTGLNRNAGPARLFPAAKPGVRFQVVQDRPEELLRHLRRAFPIGIGKTVAAGRRGPANGGQGPRLQLQQTSQTSLRPML